MILIALPTTFLVLALPDHNLATLLQTYMELSFPITFSFFPVTKYFLIPENDWLGSLIYLTSILLKIPRSVVKQRVSLCFM